MNTSNTAPIGRLLSGLSDLLPTLETTYKDVHAHPELWMQETRTPGIAAKHHRDNGYEVAMGHGIAR